MLSETPIAEALRLRLSAEPKAPTQRLTRHQRAAIILIGRNALTGRYLSKRQFGWVFPENERKNLVSHGTLRDLVARGLARLGDNRAPDLTERGYWMMRSMLREQTGGANA